MSELTLIKGRVVKVTRNKAGEESGFQLHDHPAWFNFSKAEYRGMPWDPPVPGAVVEVGVTPANPSANGTPAYWVKTINRLDLDTLPFDPEIDFDGDPVPWLEETAERAHTIKAEKLKEFTHAEGGRDRSIERQVACKAAAEVAAAYLTEDRAIPCKGVDPGDLTLEYLVDTLLERFLLAVHE